MDGGRRRRTLAALLATVVALGAGCGEDEERGTAERPAASASAVAFADARAGAAMAAREHRRLMTVGERVFAEQCDFCHRLNGRRPARIPPPDAYGPSFDHIEPTEAYVARRVARGATAMGAFEGLLSFEEIRAVARFVATRAGRAVVDRDVPPATMAAGERVFERHCRRCHTLADRPRSGVPRWMPTDFNDVKPSAAYVRSLLSGKGNAFLLEFMEDLPEKLSRDEVAAVAAYVSELGGGS